MSTLRSGFPRLCECGRPAAALWLRLAKGDAGARGDWERLPVTLREQVAEAAGALDAMSRPGAITPAAVAKRMRSIERSRRGDSRPGRRGQHVAFNDAEHTDTRVDNAAELALNVDASRLTVTSEAADEPLVPHAELRADGVDLHLVTTWEAANILQALAEALRIAAERARALKSTAIHHAARLAGPAQRNG